MYLSALSRKLPTRAMVVYMYMVSSVAQNVRTPATVVTHGPTKDRNASRVTLWCTPTPNEYYEDQTHVRANAYIYIYVYMGDISL